MRVFPELLSSMPCHTLPAPVNGFLEHMDMQPASMLTRCPQSICTPVWQQCSKAHVCLAWVL